MPLVGADVDKSASGRKRSLAVGEEPRAANGREKENAADRLEFARLATRCSGEVDRLLMMLLRWERVDKGGGVLPVE